MDFTERICEVEMNKSEQRTEGSRGIYDPVQGQMTKTREDGRCEFPFMIIAP